MYIIKDPNDMAVTELKPNMVLAIKNVSTKNAALNIYVANKDSVAATLAAGSTVKITVGSAGEAYFYMAQQMEGVLTVDDVTSSSNSDDTPRGDI